MRPVDVARNVGRTRRQRQFVQPQRPTDDVSCNLADRTAAWHATRASRQNRPTRYRVRGCRTDPVATPIDPVTVWIARPTTGTDVVTTASDDVMASSDDVDRCS